MLEKAKFKIKTAWRKATKRQKTGFFEIIAGIPCAIMSFLISLQMIYYENIEKVAQIEQNGYYDRNIQINKYAMEMYQNLEIPEIMLFLAGIGLLIIGLIDMFKKEKNDNNTGSEN